MAAMDEMTMPRHAHTVSTSMLSAVAEVSYTPPKMVKMKRNAMYTPTLVAVAAMNAVTADGA